jgi:hypothetical protein
MTEKQARALLQTIQHEAPQIMATFDASHKRNKYGYTLKLVLKPANLTMTVYSPEDWESVKYAWHYWLPNLEIKLKEIKVKEKPVKYLVDGLPMVFVQSKDGYWRGRAWHNKQDHCRYFGKFDPRGSYPIYEEKEKVNV